MENSLGVQEAPIKILLTTLILTKISIWIRNMLEILPSSKESKVGIGFLNQPICPRGIKYFNSMVNWFEDWPSNVDYYGRKQEQWCIPYHGSTRLVRALIISSSLLKLELERFEGSITLGVVVDREGVEEKVSLEEDM